MVTNNKKLENISGSDTIKDSWPRLLTRDQNISNLFSGDEFPADPTTQVEGTPNWRTDLKRLFVFIQGRGFVDLFSLITPEELAFSSSSYPSEIATVEDALEYLNQRKQDSTLVLPGRSQIFVGDGTRTEFPLKNTTEAKELVFCYIDGVKQNYTDYELNGTASAIIFNIAPNSGETIEIMENSSWVQYRISPIVKVFEYAGGDKVFDMEVELYNTSSVFINVDGKILQTSEFEVSGSVVTILSTLAVGASVEISTIMQTNITAPGPSTVNALSIQEGVIETRHLGDIALQGTALVDGTVPTSKFANKAVTTSKLADLCVTNAKLGEGSVSLEKLSQLVAEKLIGNKNISGTNIADNTIGLNNLTDELKALIQGS